ncbi:unnamed protein product [Periconia digitata]|uniref:Uncharacterized protein n=1 Tax=Periconia digitata TaxID=1303443 RepID=A0A9W4UG91_9PLEO|nr:unnamed protein product [Periconia digitata]
MLQRGLREMHQSFTRRGELSQTYPTLGKDLSSLCIHEISLIVNDLADADLGDFDAASKARTRIAVERGIFSDAVTASLEKSIFLGMET